MPRFTIDTFNTGSIPALGSQSFDRLIYSNRVDIGKIKVIPSGSTIGYTLEIFKSNIGVIKQWGTKPQWKGNFYDPTDRDGNEVEEGFVIPYEDLDSTKTLHYRITNHDSVARSYNISTYYEVPAAIGTSDGRLTDVLVVGVGVTTNIDTESIYIGGNGVTFQAMDVAHTSINECSNFIFARSRGIMASRSVLLDGDAIGIIQFKAYSDSFNASNVQIIANVDGPFAGGQRAPSSLEIRTQNITSVSAPKNWQLDSEGRMYVTAPNSPPTDSKLWNTGGVGSNQGSISFYLSESSNELKVRVRYSDGTLKTGIVALV